MSIEADLIDKRVIRRNLERAVVERATFQKYLEQLPDCASKCVQATPEATAKDDESDLQAAVAP